MSVPRTDADIEFADYGSIIRRRWLLVVLGLFAGVAAAVLAIVLIPKTYTSTASVMVQSTGEDGSVQNGRTSTPINLDTEAQIVKSTVVSQQVIEAMDDPIETDPRELAKHVLVTVPPNTSVLNISFSASSADDAQAGAAQFAESYLTNRNDVAQARLEGEARSIQAQVETLQTRLRAQSQRISRLPADSSEREYEASQRDLLVDQLAALNSELVRVTSTEIMPGDVITDAQRPTTPSDPNVKVLAASGLLAGLLLGLLLAVLVDRGDKRIRDRRDLERLGLETLVARVDVPAPRDVPFTPGGGRGVESLRQLRNALLARLPQGRGLVLVSGMSNDQAGSAVSISLAATLARSGVNALLVSANSVRCAVSDAFDAGDRQGLADVLRGHAAANDVVFDVPGMPGLRAVTAGSDGSLYSELLQSSHVQSVIDELAAQAEVLVIDMAPTTVNADTQSLAAIGYGVLLVATELKTKRAEVVDAIDQCQHVAATMLGSVVARVQPERTGAGDGEAAAPAAPPADGADQPHSTGTSSEESDDGVSPELLESTLVDLPAVREDRPGEHARSQPKSGTAAGNPTSDAAASEIDRPASLDDEDEEDEQRPVYIRDRQREEDAEHGRRRGFSLSRSGAPRPGWRDD